jgi:hypothetical protein
MTKQHIILVGIWLILLSASAFGQSMTMAPLPANSKPLTQWDTEINLDTIDQEKLPRIVTGGLLASANISNFMIFQNGNLFSSNMKVGAGLGGFVDFTVTKHFAIQGRLILTAEQNRFKDTEAYNQLWALGVNIPVLLLARFGNLEGGYLSFGGGAYTHFNYASNLGQKGAEIYKLHDNHFGLTTTITYEFPIGIQVLANYFVSLTDIISFNKKNAAAASSVQGIYPQRVELGLAYRWRTGQQR